MKLYSSNPIETFKAVSMETENTRLKIKQDLGPENEGHKRTGNSILRDITIYRNIYV